MGKFKVVLDGFDTEEQALEWASWYEGSGEQDFDFEEGGSVLTDMELLEGGFRVNNNNEVIIPIKIFLDEEN